MNELEKSKTSPLMREGNLADRAVHGGNDLWKSRFKRGLKWSDGCGD